MKLGISIITILLITFSSCRIRNESTRDEIQHPDIDSTKLYSLWDLYTVKLYRDLQSAQKEPEQVIKLALYRQNLRSVPEGIEQFTYMNSFHVTGNQISELPESIGQLQYLQSLHLGDNEFSSFPEVLFDCPQLRKLVLDDNQLTVIPKRIGEMHKLESLEITGNQISSIPRQLYELENLKVLAFEENHIKKVPPGIERLESLTTLNLMKNDITQLPESIVEMKLKRLSLSGNPMTEKYIEELILKMPDTKIEF